MNMLSFVLLFNLIIVMVSGVPEPAPDPDIIISVRQVINLGAMKGHNANEPDSLPNEDEVNVEALEEEKKQLEAEITKAKEDLEKKKEEVENLENEVAKEKEDIAALDNMGSQPNPFGSSRRRKRESFFENAKEVFRGLGDLYWGSRRNRRSIPSTTTQTITYCPTEDGDITDTGFNIVFKVLEDAKTAVTIPEDIPLVVCLFNLNNALIPSIAWTQADINVLLPKYDEISAQIAITKQAKEDALKEKEKRLAEKKAEQEALEKEIQKKEEEKEAIEEQIVDNKYETTEPPVVIETTEPTAADGTTQDTDPNVGPSGGDSTGCDYASDFGASHTMNKYSGPASECGAYHDYEVTDGDIENILKLHNDLRQKVAKGEEIRGSPGPQPGATNMYELRWNDELAEVAQRWAEQCQLGHDKGDDRKICNQDYYVGQNAFMEWHFDATTAWDKAVNGWYDEVLDMPEDLVSSFGNHPQGKVIGHYTQVVWAGSYEVGCGGIHFPSKIGDKTYEQSKVYVCNYGKGGNWLGSEIYEIGTAASNCPYGESTNYPGLCTPPPS